LNRNSKRIIYVDIMRAFAVIMMIQGHTVDTFLADDYRTAESFLYSVWYTLRGFTAPIFMFTAGLVFTYLLKSDDYEFFKNPRVKKGLKRALTLIFIGYLLRYPTHRIFDFSNVSQSQWNIFFAVDALHLIGFGLLTIIFCLFLAKRAHLNLNLIFYLIIIFVLIFSPVITKIDWIYFMPQYLASYLTKSYGSLFPLFPWIVYVIAGALLGNYLYKNQGIYFKKRFSLSLTSIGLALIVLSALLFYLQDFTDKDVSYWLYSNGMVSLRVGGVVLINGIMAFIVRKIDKIPFIVLNTGKKTLMLYVIHIVILYGCAWFPGLYRYYAKSFNPVETLIAVILMFSLLLSIVHISDKLKTLKKRKIALNKV